MPELTITRPATGRIPAAPPRGKHPKAKLVPEDGKPLVLPYAPRGSSLGGWADTWETQERPGRRPLVTRNGEGLEVLGFDVLLAHPDHQTSIEGLLAQLRALAGSGERITILGMSPRERGPWRLESVSVTAELRQHGTNHITRATVALGFLEASDANPRLGPVTGGKKKRKKNPGKGKAGIKKARRYTLKKGDTLRKLAGRFYGEPNEWKRIAKRNQIKHPNDPKPGRTIVIPPDDKD